MCSEGLVELLADNLPAAEKALRDGYRRLEQRGGRSALATTVPSRTTTVRRRAQPVRSVAQLVSESPPSTGTFTR
jgi:hypothetical protein